MKKIIFLTIIILSITTLVYGAELSDVKGHWAEKNIYRLELENVINGYDDGTFKPENNVTVAEFLKLLVTGTDYKKVLEGNPWPDWYINTSKYYGFILENEFDNFDKYITRYEAVKILSRYLQVENKTLNKKVFTDTDDKTVLTLNNLGIIQGYEDNTFKGDNFITRAEASTIICRALDARREIVANKKYSLQNAEKLTNIGRNASYKSDYINRYEIRNNKIYFYDTGRYAKLDGYTIADGKVTNKMLINLIESLIQEDAYVGVSYIPDDRLIDQITINYGKREGYVYNHSYTFGFTFYPDKPYELKRISQNNNLSEECFMKITVGKMWKDLIELENNEYVNIHNHIKLQKALESIFDKNTAQKIDNYIQELIPRLHEKSMEETCIEVKKIGKYEINLYNTGGTRVELYISK